MAIKKIEIRPKGDGTYSDVLYPKTNVDQVEGLQTALDGKAPSSHTSDTIAHVTSAERNNWNSASSHTSDSVKHITAIERAAWNNKASIRTGGASSTDPNLAMDAVFLTNHGLIQNAGETGNYWYVRQTFYSTTNNRTQWASKYNGIASSSADFKVRHYFEGQGWSPWSPSFQSLFTSVSNGKQAIANAITGKGIATSGTAEFATMANNISNISTGVKFASGTASANKDTRLPFVDVISGNNGSLSYIQASGLTFRPSLIVTFSNSSQSISVYQNKVNYKLFGSDITKVSPDTLFYEGLRGNGASGYVNSSSFRIPLYISSSESGNHTFYWYAFE